MATTARWSQMLSFIWSMHDGHLRAVSTSDTVSVTSSGHCLTTGLRHADHDEVRVVLTKFRREMLRFAAEAQQITVERLTSRARGMAVRTADLARIAAP